MLDLARALPDRSREVPVPGCFAREPLQGGSDHASPLTWRSCHTAATRSATIPTHTSEGRKMN